MSVKAKTAPSEAANATPRSYHDADLRDQVFEDYLEAGSRRFKLGPIEGFERTTPPPDLTAEEAWFRDRPLTTARPEVAPIEDSPKPIEVAASTENDDLETLRKGAL